MYILSKKEQVVLDLIEDRWKWIARERDGGLSLFTKKPVKNSNNWYYDGPTEKKPWTTLEALNPLIFNFVSWYNDEPTDLEKIRDEAGRRHCNNCENDVIPLWYWDSPYCPVCGRKLDPRVKVDKKD